MELTIFDYTVLGIMVFFTLLGLVRGFIQELSSLVNWIGSGLLTVLLREPINNLIDGKISNPIVSNMVSSITIFVIAIIGFSILTSSVAKTINTKFPSSINITLGLAFGFTKGFLICSLIFATILNLFGNTEDLSSKSGPEWFQKSETYRPLSLGAYMILPFADSILGRIKDKYNKNNIFHNNNNNEEKVDSVDKPEKSDDKDKINEKSKENGGYKKEQLEKLNHLIEIL